MPLSFIAFITLNYRYLLLVRYMHVHVLVCRSISHILLPCTIFDLNQCVYVPCTTNNCIKFFINNNTLIRILVRGFCKSYSSVRGSLLFVLAALSAYIYIYIFSYLHSLGLD